MDADRLKGLELFAGLTRDELDRCAAMFEETEILAGSGLIREEDYSYKFFVILDGTVTVLRAWAPIAELGPGEFFGEMGVMSSERRNARVVAKTRCTLAKSVSWDFRQIAEDYPDFAAKIQTVIDERAKSLATDD